MPLPIDLAGDWKRFNADLLREIQYAAYSPTADDPSAYAAGVDCVGVRGALKTGWDGARAVSTRQWTFTDLDGIPAVNSRIIDGTDVYVITAVQSDAVSDRVHIVETYRA